MKFIRCYLQSIASIRCMPRCSTQRYASALTLNGSRAMPEPLQFSHHWKIREDRAIRKLEFQDFRNAMKFVNTVAEIAERLGHHPDLEISYNKVAITLATHDAGNLTTLDATLAS